MPTYIGIDLQEGFLTDEIRKTGYVERVENFIAKKDRERVTLTWFSNEPNSNFTTLLGRSDMKLLDPSRRLFGSLEDGGYGKLHKTTYTAWLPAVQRCAKEFGYTDVVLVGLDTDDSVLKTALDIFEAGYRPVVLTDLCASGKGKDKHDDAIDLLKTLIGERQVITSDELLSETP